MGYCLAKLRILMGRKCPVQKLGQLFLVPLLLRVPAVQLIELRAAPPLPVLFQTLDKQAHALPFRSRKSVFPLHRLLL